VQHTGKWAIITQGNGRENVENKNEFKGCPRHEENLY
jgi:hypothetical protein